MPFVRGRLDPAHRLMKLLDEVWEASSPGAFEVRPSLRQFVQTTDGSRTIKKKKTPPVEGTDGGKKEKRTLGCLRIATPIVVIVPRCIIVTSGDDRLTREEGKDDDQRGENSRELHCVESRERLHRSRVGEQKKVARARG